MMTNLSHEQQVILDIVKEGNGKAAFYTSEYERDRNGNNIFEYFRKHCRDSGLACATARSQPIQGLIRRGLLEKIDSIWRAVIVKLPENGEG